jgi:hypothetical protein
MFSPCFIRGIQGEKQGKTKGNHSGTLEMHRGAKIHRIVGFQGIRTEKRLKPLNLNYLGI